MKHLIIGTTVHVILVRRQRQDDKRKRKNPALSSSPQEMSQKIAFASTDCIYFVQGNSAWLPAPAGFDKRVLMKLSRIRILLHRRMKGVCMFSTGDWIGLD